ncbi:MAG: hypothetical protein IJL92_01080 [Thermoguttaceae bacterium]|nr:hypothetical protein [Thermoguttaceae bacterium]
MKKPLNPKWELLLSVLIFVISCLAVALFGVWLELAFGWQPDHSPFRRSRRCKQIENA